MDTSKLTQIERKDKPWGKAYPIDDGPYHEVLLLEIHPGGYCSIHEHATKLNKFVVVSGELIVTWWHEGQERRAVLTTLETITLPCGTRHRFEAITDCLVIETYYPRFGAGENDIVRWELGGKK